MSKRARYDGPFDEVLVFDPEQDVYAKPIDTVKRGGLLSADVPARVRDELVAGSDWTEVQHSSPSNATKTPEEAKS